MAGWHTVAQGECLSSLAAEHQLASWHTIYDHAENSSFRTEHPNPNIIHPGDVVYIPDPEIVHKDKPTDKKHTFVRKMEKTLLRIVAADEDGQPYKQSDYQLTIGDKVYEGKTDGRGMVEVEIDPTADAGVLSVWWPGELRRHSKWKLSIGHLDPVNQISGIQARLNNLGFNSGPVDGIRGKITTAAVKEFQKKRKLAVDGIPGPVTQAKLKEVYGC